MDGQEVSATRDFSARGTIRKIGYTAFNEVEYIGLANFNAPDGGDFWYITKFTWEVVGLNRCMTNIEDSGVRRKWTDRTSVLIMGWRT